MLPKASWCISQRGTRPKQSIEEWDEWDKTIGDEGCAHKVKVEYNELNPPVPLSKFARAPEQTKGLSYYFNSNVVCQNEL